MRLLNLAIFCVKTPLPGTVKLVEIRKVEELTADIVQSGEVYTPCHLSIGQEAIAVGVANSLTADDFVYSNHRSHAHFLHLADRLTVFLQKFFAVTAVCPGVWWIAASDLRGGRISWFGSDSRCDNSDCGRSGVFGEIQKTRI